MTFLSSLKLDGLLSFPNGTDPIELLPLNLVIGPNGSGKSNFVEGIELLHATPTSFADAIRFGGLARDWLFKGSSARTTEAKLEAVARGSTASVRHRAPDLRYRLSFTSVSERAEITDEAIERPKPLPGKRKPYVFYDFQRGNPVINVLGKERHLERQSLTPDESVLSQRRDPEHYPEIDWLAGQFAKIVTFREWTFGRTSPVRVEQQPHMSNQVLLPNATNLAQVLDRLEHYDDAWAEFARLMTLFLPRFGKLRRSTGGGHLALYLHEKGLASPVPARRLSDGTLRFITLLTILLDPTPPPLVCIEEPELGLHPDAVQLLGEVLCRASERMQLVVTTHSETLVSSLTDRVESVLVCENIGGTVMRRLESERLKHWLTDYKLGEVWRMGELGGNP